MPDAWSPRNSAREVGPVLLDEQTIADIARLVLRLTGSSSELTYEPVPADDPVRRRPDISRAKATLGWEPTITLEDGLTRTIEDFRSRLATPDQANARARS